jgi:hypothetical protein
VAPRLQRQVFFMLDGATGRPALDAGPVCTGIHNRFGSTDSCEDRGRLVLLAETEEVEEAALPSGARPIPRGRALQRTSRTSVRLRPRGMQLENPGPGIRASTRHCMHASVNSIGRCRRRGRTLRLWVALPSGLPAESGSGSADLGAAMQTGVQATAGQTVRSD